MKNQIVTFFKFIIGNPTCVKIEDFDAITMVTNCHKISIECKTQSCRLRGGRLGFLQRRLLFTLPNETVFQCWSKGGRKGGEWIRNYVNGGLTLSAINALNECPSPPDQSWSCLKERTTDRIELFICSGTWKQFTRRSLDCPNLYRWSNNTQPLILYGV